MSFKRNVSQVSDVHTSPNKKTKTVDWNSYLHKTMIESGLTLKHPPEKCIASYETIVIIRNIKNKVQKHLNYPRNLHELFSNLENECSDWDVFKQYIFPNIVRVMDDSPEEMPIMNDSVFKILLSIPLLQSKLIDYIFEKATDLAAESKCGPWIQMILKCICSLDSVVNTEKVSRQLINLLDTASETLVKLEVITTIPDIIGDQEHDHIAYELSRILSEDQKLVPAILDCLSNLCLSDEKYEQLQKKTLDILKSLAKYDYLPNFVKFLLLSGHMSDNTYVETIQGLRNALGWSISKTNQQDVASSQVLTATAIRNTMISSKVIANSWLKVISMCKESSDHKPIDFIILLVLYTTSEEKQRQVENVIKKQVKLNILKEDILIDSFEKFKPILKKNLKYLVELTNSLLKTQSDPILQSFASQIYTMMITHLDNCCQTIIAEMLQLGLERKQCVMSILIILNNVAAKDMSSLKPQSIQMLMLLDRMDDMSLTEVRAVMNLLCGLAFTYENSVIRDDMHIMIRKQLGCSSPPIKINGILAGVHAVKYLMVANDNEENTIDFPDDVSYGSVTHLSEGDIKEAAQVIELISRGTRQFPDLTAFFYDELTNIISSAQHINKNFLTWLTDAVTNDIQQNFIVDCVEAESIGNVKLSMQYCLNADSEMDEVIAINIGGASLQLKHDINVGILSPLFQLVQTLHYKQHDGNLSSIDALLGCAVVMPNFDIDIIEEFDCATIANILDCLIHCINWFRELLNAFATQTDDALKTKMLKRIIQIEELEKLVGEILFKSKISYKPPSCTFNIIKYTGAQIEKKHPMTQITKLKTKKSGQDETLIPETVRSQLTPGASSVKSKISIVCSLPLRQLSLNLMHIFNIDLSSDKTADTFLTVRNMNFLLKNVNSNLERVLISKIKRRTFLTKQEDCEAYDPQKAEKYAKSVNEILPKLIKHLEFVISYIDCNNADNCQNESGFILTSEIMEYITCLESIYKMCTIYLKWIGFHNHNTVMLKNSLKIIACMDKDCDASIKEILLNVAKVLQQHDKYCLQLSTAVSLIEFMKTIAEHSDSKTIIKILRDLAHNFLSQAWKTPDGVLEKGLYFNQSVDKLATIYFINNEIVALKTLTLQLTNEIKILKSKSDTLNSFQSINKNNFTILYRNLGSAICEATKTKLSKGLTNSEHLTLWKEVATTLKYMSEIAKTLETRNNLSAFFKKSLPILKLFLSQGIPILEIEFKNNIEEILEILKILQQSTRFLQTLCCHSRLKKDTVLMNKVPAMRHLLETLIYKVKAALAANSCSEAFWMGNLKNKNIHGEVIATQQSEQSEESVEDCDEQLPDDDSDDSDDEILNPDSKSLSDIV